MPYRFAGFHFDPEAGSLIGPGGPVHLRPQSLQLLEVLVHEAPRIVSTNEIIDRVWGVDHVSAASIRQVVSELRQALGDSAARPEILLTVHRRGYRLIADIEETETGSPQASADEAPPSAAPARSTRRAAIAVASLVLAGFGWWVSTAPQTNTPKDDTGTKPRLAVLPLDNLTGDPGNDWLDLAIRDLLRGELALPGTCILATEQQENTADIVLQGSYFATSEPAGGIDFRIQILETASGELNLAREAGMATALPSIARRLARSVLATIFRDDALNDRQLVAQNQLASSTESLKLFTDAVAASIRLDHSAARSSLERAVEIDPDNPLHHDLLAATYQELGLDPLAKESIERASRLMASLTTEHQQSVTARAAEVHGRWAEAERLLRPLSLRFPDEVSYRVRLAHSLFHLGQLNEALRTVRQSRRATVAQHGDPRLELLEVQILRSQRRFAEAELIALGLRAGEADTSESLPAEALTTLLKIHLKTGRIQEAAATLEQLEKLSAAGSGENGLLIGFRAALFERLGRFDESRAAYRDAVSLFTALGNRDGETSQLNRWALLLYDIGETETATELLERAMHVGRKAGNPLPLAVSRCLAAQAYARLGQLERAQQLADQALGWSVETDDAQRTALCLRASAFILLTEESLAAAEARYRQALDLSLGVPDISGTSEAYHGLGSVALESGQPRLAGNYFTRAAAGFEKLSSLPRWLDSRCALAEIELASGDPTHAAALFEEVLRNATKWSLTPYQVRARAGLAGVAEQSAEGSRDSRPAAG